MSAASKTANNSREQDNPLSTNRLGLLDAYGIELEYMLVDQDTLDVHPVADILLAALAGGTITSDYESGPMSWSNELTLHVIELQTTKPAKNIRSLPAPFETAIRNRQPALESLNLRLLPTAMHPWMHPADEAELWPREYHEIYQAYGRIFDCRTHGWANVQSVHLNRPFSGNFEFAKLHAAVRLVNSILCIPVSSPVFAKSPSYEARNPASQKPRSVTQSVW